MNKRGGGYYQVGDISLPLQFVESFCGTPYSTRRGHLSLGDT